MQKKWSVRMLTEGGVMIALAYVLGLIKLYELPQGGSVTPASMLPLFIFALRWGLGPGLAAATLYGVLDGLRGSMVGLVPFLLDYPIAFGMLGLAGLFSARFLRETSPKAGILGICVGTFMRFVCHTISGIVFYGSNAPAGKSVWLYAAEYNGSFLLVDTVIVIVVFLLIQPKISRGLLQTTRE